MASILDQIAEEKMKDIRRAVRSSTPASFAKLCSDALVTPHWRVVFSLTHVVEIERLLASVWPRLSKKEKKYCNSILSSRLTNYKPKQWMKQNPP